MIKFRVQSSSGRDYEMDQADWPEVSRLFVTNPLSKEIKMTFHDGAILTFTKLGI